MSFMGYIGCVGYLSRRVPWPLKPQRRDGRRDSEPFLFSALIAPLRLIWHSGSGYRSALMCNRPLDLTAAWLFRGYGFEFRKYKVAPRLGTPVLRRRLLARLRAVPCPSGYIRVQLRLN
jgi:hypothetical protein